jgi:alpha-mannosidase
MDIGSHLTGRRWRGREHSSTIRIVENGPVRLVIEMAGKLLDASTRTQRIVLYRDLPKIDLETSLDWQGKRNALVYQVFPLEVPEPTVRYAVPYGWQQYGREMKYAAPWFASAPMPVARHHSRGVRGWVELAHGSNAVALATDCNYVAFKDLSEDPEAGFLVQPLLLRTVRSCGDGGRLYYEQKGRHVFHFALQANGDAVRFGREADAPLLTHWTIEGEAGKRELPDRLSLLAVDEKTVHVAVVKQAEDSHGFIVRLVETSATGAGASATLRAFRPLGSATQTNIIEEDDRSLAVTGGTVRLSLAPGGIETLRIRF